ncbi:MAG: hypothetical protein HRU17_11065 [Polyangiaceae bacterium]|nr:hypothetical protein [Polyangiaceae bacterium]
MSYDHYSSILIADAPIRGQKHPGIWIASLLALSLFVACEESADDSAKTGGGTGGTDSSDSGATDTGMTAEDIGNSCVENTDCSSGVCLQYSDSPDDPDAVCGGNVELGAFRATGVARDFFTGDVLANAHVGIADALAALMNPLVTPFAETTTDSEGRYDVTTPVAPGGIGSLAVLNLEGYWITATGLVAPEAGVYPPGVTVHELWSISETELAGWNSALEGEVDLATHLPLGTNGGVVGLARDRQTGVPLGGVTVLPKADSSTAILRYLSEDGTSFTTQGTASKGLFVILNPGVGESFTADIGAGPIEAVSGKAGATPGALFVTVLNVPTGN